MTECRRTAELPTTGSETDARELRRTLGTFLTGVTVVTTVDETGTYRGITANSFTSVSLDPPLVLVCVDRAAASYSAFRDSAGFGVHILGHDQRELAARFATKSPHKFDGLSCRIGHGGAPLLPDSVAWLDCSTEQQVEAGSHVVLFGRVRAFGATGRRPLAYWRGRFVPLTPEQGLEGGERAHAVTAGWIAETGDGRLLLERLDGGGWTIPRSSLSGVTLEEDALAVAAGRCLGAPAEVGFLYSLYDVSSDGRVLLVYRVRIEGSGDEQGGLRALFDVDDLPWSEIPERHTAGMLRRYVRERAGDGFGIYAGSALRGRYAMLDER